MDSLGKKRIQIWINSPGGIVIDGMSIYNAILKTKTKVDTYVTGMAASISAVIFTAGAKRLMADYGILMFHNAHGGDDSTLLIMNESINEMIARTGMNKEAIEEMMNRTTFLSADEALQLGIATEIENSTEFNKKRATSAQNNIKSFQTVCNKLTDEKFSNMAFPKVANKLKLNSEASEESIVTAIDEIQNKLSAAEVSNKKTKEELDKLKNDMEEAENKFKDLEDKYNKAKKELDDTKDSAMTEKCQNMVKKYAAEGRIKNEQKVIDKWVAMAKAEFDATEETLKELPLNKVANKLDRVEEKPTKVQNMATAMAEIAAKNGQILGAK